MKRKFRTIILVLFTVVVAGICIFYWLNTKKSNYGQWDKQHVKSTLEIFPEDIEKLDNNQYIYKKSSGLLDDYYQIYLKRVLDKNNYDDEIARIKEISNSYKGKKQEIQYDEQNFKYPAYVTISGLDHTHEYVLTDEANHTIYYIYIQNLYSKDIKFDKDLLPKYFNKNENNSFNIYAYDLENAGEWFYNIRR